MFQSFVTPFFIGVSEFGRQMLLLAPIFLMQALLESSFQAAANAGASKGRCALPLARLLLQSTILMGLAVLIAPATFNALLAVGLAISHIGYTLVFSVLFSLRDVALAAVARYAGLFAYMASFAIFARSAPSSSIILANLFGFSIPFLFAFAILRMRGTLELAPRSRHQGASLSSLLYRLPTISFTSVTTILLGVAGAPLNIIGEFRILMAAISAGRYFNPVPLPVFQASIHRYLKFGDKEMKRLALQYACYFAIFCVGTALFFPVVYELAYIAPTFSRTALVAASFFVILQPLSYFVFASHPNAHASNIALSAGASVAALAVFWFLYETTRMADLAAGVSIFLVVSVYAASATNSVIASSKI